MTEPVIDPEGHTYELKAIEEWLAKSPTSPITRSPLHSSDLVPNRALRDTIAQWRDSNSSSSTAPIATAVAGASSSSSSSLAAATAVRTEVSVTASAAEEDGNTDVLVRLATVGPALRAPAVVVCVIDVSGSMGEEATVQNRTGTVESHGLSLLDVVKHTVRTIVEALQPCDKLALVSFSSSACVELVPTYMDADGKKLAAASLQRLVPQGSTNLWDGLFRSLELLRPVKGSSVVVAKEYVSSVLLFTDGMPTVEPPRGHVPMLRRYRESNNCHGVLPAAVSTFGFGYSLDSNLLAGLAAEGGGSFNFIPDAGLVGTVFVNAAANLLSVGAKNAVLTLRPLNGATFVAARPIGWPAAAMQKPKTLGDMCISLGSIQFGQPRDIIVRLRNMPPLGTAFLHAELSSSRSDRPVLVDGFNRESQMGEVVVHSVRCSAVELLENAAKMARINVDGARTKIVDFADMVKKLAIAADPRISALLEDLEGQVTMALSRSDWFDRWGKHYLPSLANAHLLQLCNNFKDPGVQQYGGRLFSNLRDEIDELFIRLPPPTPTSRRPPSPTFNRPPSPTFNRPPSPTANKPSPAHHKQQRRQSSDRDNMRAQSRRPIVDMSAYMDACGGCFAGHCNVLVGDGKTVRRVDSIRRGDVLAGGAKVVCVVKTTCAKGSAMLAELPGGLLITPWHPVDVEGNGKWQFPHDIAPETVKERPCTGIYTFVLDSVHHASVCGIRCVTLGHGAVGDIREHPYYGTHRVVDDLMAAPGWQSDGLVELAPAQVIRDPQTHLVHSIAISEC